MKTTLRIAVICMLAPLMLTSVNAETTHHHHRIHHVRHHHDRGLDSKVDHTFRGVGADMEEGLTGHRTVDR
jgi:hypothetical protein